jgi:membrane-bound serine protease (ClpP class)
MTGTRHLWNVLRTVWLPAVALALAAAALGAATPSAPVVTIKLAGPIGPATADYVHRSLAKAQARNAALVVIELDTPGGLDTAMREIIKDILGSPIPVATYVAPGGARAASAGTYILYASHVAAMAPATNLGAATPVPIGLPGMTPRPPTVPGEGDAKTDAAKKAPNDTVENAAKGGEAMQAKMLNDAAAYIRSLAQLRGRNADFAERAVREAKSLSAEEALKARVIDLLATDVPDLLAKLDGREVKTTAGAVRLQTTGAAVESLKPDWRTEFLSVVSNPTVALILLLVGVYGLFIEFTHPGVVLPGVVGAIALLLAFFAFQLLPVNYAGLGLILLGIALMVAEAFVPSFGALGIGGIAAFVLGGVLLFDRDIPGLSIPLGVLAGIGIASGIALAGIGGLILRSRRRRVVSGREELAGAPGEVIEWTGADGWAHVHGETWKVRAASPIAAGTKIRVKRLDGLTLEVEPAPGHEHKGG